MQRPIRVTASAPPTESRFGPAHRSSRRTPAACRPCPATPPWVSPAAAQVPSASGDQTWF